MIVLRSALFHIWYVVLSFVIYTAAIPIFLGPRKLVIRAAQLWARLMLWALRVFCGQHYEVRGLEHAPKGGVLVASKHYSMWETIAFMVLVDDPAIVMKRELMWVPFYGWYGIKMGMIPIDRKGRGRALRALRRAAKKATDDGRQIILFPEGTRREIGAPPSYKTGIAGIYSELDVPCVPVALNSGLVWRSRFLIHPGTIVVEFLPHIPPGLPRSEFMRTLEERIETATHALLGARHD